MWAIPIIVSIESGPSRKSYYRENSRNEDVTSSCCSVDNQITLSKLSQAVNKTELTDGCWYGGAYWSRLSSSKLFRTTFLHPSRTQHCIGLVRAGLCTAANAFNQPTPHKKRKTIKINKTFRSKNSTVSRISFSIISATNKASSNQYKTWIKE